MTTHVISSHDTYEISWYLLHGYDVEKIHVISKNGTLKCQFSIVGDEALKRLQEEYYDNPVVKLNDFRGTLHRVNSLMGMARKKAKVEASHKEAST